ncbi:MAG TPA: 2-C-methyl-D-erythritol 2,4-cyclodiphosphate synthase [Blastocatellia bacterium]|nr:2-C-methyl-D-erythritol 2,4-cyclodiphosphate synthase [Blastocatellia bacterium]
MNETLRIGIGFDIHRLVEGRTLVLGGVEIPFEKGLLGHSDSDVLAHAICDALLGAAALGDIGTHFPDTDPKYAGASSMELLAHVVDMVKGRGYAILNVDSTVLAERPKVAPHIPAIRSRLAQALGVELAAVSVKAKTMEGLGDIGAGNAMAAQAVTQLGPSGR